MSKQIMPLMRGSLSSIIDSPFPTFIDEFFADALPVSLINRVDSFPKYNIYRDSKDITDKFTVELSLAGYPKDGLNVYTEDGKLYVEDTTAGEVERDYLYKGITTKHFKWSLKLPEFSVIDKVIYVNGLLRIHVKIEIPEEKKPKTYKIYSDEEK